MVSTVFRDTHGDDALRQFGAGADLDLPAIEQRGPTGFDGPCFVPHRIMDDTGKEFVVAADRDGCGEMGDAIKVVHGAVQGVDNPFAVAGSFCNAFLAEDGVAGMAGQDVILDEALGAAVEFEFDVVSVAWHRPRAAFRNFRGAVFRRGVRHRRPW